MQSILEGASNMNLGSNILELRRKKNVTQEDLATQLGVTAAAVSKWENGYTFPDLLMLCALADYFEVTTDALLGRIPTYAQAVIAAKTRSLGEKIATVAKRYGLETLGIYDSYAQARSHILRTPTIRYVLVSLDRPLTEEEMQDAGENLAQINVQCDSDQQTLDSFEFYFRNMSTIDSFCKKA